MRSFRYGNRRLPVNADTNKGLTYRCSGNGDCRRGLRALADIVADIDAYLIRTSRREVSREGVGRLATLLNRLRAANAACTVRHVAPAVRVGELFAFRVARLHHPRPLLPDRKRGRSREARYLWRPVVLVCRVYDGEGLIGTVAGHVALAIAHAHLVCTRVCLEHTRRLLSYNPLKRMSRYISSNLNRRVIHLVKHGTCPRGAWRYIPVKVDIVVDGHKRLATVVPCNVFQTSVIPPLAAVWRNDGNAGRPRFAASDRERCRARGDSAERSTRSYVAYAHQVLSRGDPAGTENNRHLGAVVRRRRSRHLHLPAGRRQDVHVYELLIKSLSTNRYGRTDGCGGGRYRRYSRAGPDPIRDRIAVGVVGAARTVCICDTHRGHADRDIARDGEEELLISFAAATHRCQICCGRSRAARNGRVTEEHVVGVAGREPRADD